MEVQRFRRPSSEDADINGGASKDDQYEGNKRSGTRSNCLMKTWLTAAISCLIFVSSLIYLSNSNLGNSLEWLNAGGSGQINGGSFKPAEPQKVDGLLGGLLTNTFDESSCLSRYRSALYWKASKHMPSPYLLQRLRRYEALHRKCGPDTENYKMAISQLKSNYSGGSGGGGFEDMEYCSYVVWMPSDGLGNRIITIVSAFLYALLNNKILLLYLPDDLRDIFCEPFPDTTWLLPSNFPIKNFQGFDRNTPQSYGNMLRDKLVNPTATATTSAAAAALANVSLPAFAYLHLRHDYNELDKHFFCEESQRLIRRFSWLLLRSNQYFVPALFLVTEYEEELNLLFPEKETIFHHLIRYLLHPTNTVWGYVTRYHEAYLATAEERVGIQIRIFPNRPVPHEFMLAQMINCTLSERLLPEISVKEPLSITSNRRKAVLVTTLYAGYYEKLKSMYYDHPTTTGEVVGIYQPSQEKEQHTEQQNHNLKVLAEMYLLSFSDVLVTSAWSTFGYVAQGLGGLKPWILLTKGEDDRSPSCRRAMSMEPCYHSPQTYDCKLHRHIDKGAVVRHVKHCEDVPEGIKLSD